jgi:predicted Zn-dependent protease
MKTKLTLALVVSLAAGAAQAQLGDWIKKVDPSKVKAGVNMARAATRDFTEGEEAEIGRVVAARVLATYPLSTNEPLQQYVTLVGNTVAAYSARPTLEWHFAVLETPVVNAFSTPGGFVFVTTGALAQMHSEAELAAVIGHELAHVTQKHILKEVKRGNLVNAGRDLAATTAAGAQWLNNDVAAKIGNVAYEKLFTTGLGRDDEREADRIGVQLADAAGYRASEMITFLTALQSLESTDALRQLTATHPSPAERIATIRPLVRTDRGAVLAERWAAVVPR